MAAATAAAATLPGSGFVDRSFNQILNSLTHSLYAEKRNAPMTSVRLADQVKSLDWRAREAEFIARSHSEGGAAEAQYVAKVIQLMR
jgi:hypothetical protein